MLHIFMTSQNQRKGLGGAGNHRVVGSVSGLAARGVELQGRALVANPANAQNLFVLAHLMLARLSRKQVKWWRQCRGEEWTCVVSRRPGGKWKALSK